LALIASIVDCGIDTKEIPTPAEKLNAINFFVVEEGASIN
jgi:hypothetical protein